MVKGEHFLEILTQFPTPVVIKYLNDVDYRELILLLHSFYCET